MQERNVQVMLASEYPEIRHLLSELTGKEPGAVVIGEAESGLKATALARSLRPDVAVLDCHLPYTVGLDAVPLSRMGGLDAALTISQDVPATRVIVLGNLDADVYREQGLRPALELCLSRQSAGAAVPLMLQEMFPEALGPSAVVFANLATRERKNLSQRIAEKSDIGIWFGGFAIFGGLLLVGTMVFAPPGALIALAGAGVLFLGIAGKVTAALWLKASLARVERTAKRERNGQGR